MRNVGLNRVINLLVVFGLVIGFSVVPLRTAAAQDEITVCPSGCDFSSIQAAVNAAASGDVVKITEGEYTASPQVVSITKSITLRGGYNADFSVWDPDVYPTVLNGAGTSRVVSAIGTIEVTLEGLVIEDGFSSSNGAGVYSEGTTLQVLDSVIQNNKVNPNYNGNYGVGLFISGGSLWMQNSLVQGNQPNPGDEVSHSGGGLYGLGAVIELHNSSFLDNIAAFGTGGTFDIGTGGGVYLENCTSNVDGVTFKNNQATTHNHGGGGLWTRGGSMNLTNSIFEANINGGAVLFDNNGALIEGNQFLSNQGSGLFVGVWTTTGPSNVTVQNNLLQNNTGSGMQVTNFALSMQIKNNQFIGNQNHGLEIKGKSNTGVLSAVNVEENLFQNNTTTLDGGGMMITGGVNVLNNRFLNNQANGKGGGVYQTETDRYDNVSALYDGNYFEGNSAAEGGGMYQIVQYSVDFTIQYQNMVFLHNTASSKGSAIYFYRYANTWVNFDHLTISNNTGGDGTMIYEIMGKINLRNSILANGDKGVYDQAGYLGLYNVLRYDVTVPYEAGWVIPIPDENPVSGDPAFNSDGYHLSAQSAAVDAGADIGVVGDIDQEPRPLGSAPDLGADESPYTSGGSGVDARLLSSDPQWKIYYTGSNVPPSSYLEINYLIPYTYFADDDEPAVSQYTITDQFPAELSLDEVTSPQNTVFNQNGSTLTWEATQALFPGEWDWIGYRGLSQDVVEGQTITNAGVMDYTLANAQSGQISFSTESLVPARPIFPPVFTTPENGEACVEEDGSLLAKGVAGAGLTVKLYEDGVFQGSTVAAENGEYSIRWMTALDDGNPVDIYVTACDSAEACSLPSSVVHLTYAENNWCPQRSYWEGDVHGVHYTFYFRNDLGRFASNDFEMPGVLGFLNTQLHLYSCCDDQSTNPFRVNADGTVYTSPSAHDGRWWTFNIGASHTVTIESQCGGIGATNPEPLRISQGDVLIDPDGFIFNSAKGGAYDSLSGIYQPVEALAGMTITAYEYITEWDTWVQWPAHLYNDQINPQVTGEDGYFAFFTPPGKYYLEVTAANGYQSWRSPVVEVINEIVHVNIPLTEDIPPSSMIVSLTPDGPQPAMVNIPPGSSITWISSLGDDATAGDWRSLNQNPLAQPRSETIDPLIDGDGFDGGVLKPGQVFSRTFDKPGVYLYSDGFGNSASIYVGAKLFLPLILR